jgi:hypothetical protein
MAVWGEPWPIPLALAVFSPVAIVLVAAGVAVCETPPGDGGDQMVLNCSNGCLQSRQ